MGPTILLKTRCVKSKRCLTLKCLVARVDLQKTHTLKYLSRLEITYVVTLNLFCSYIILVIYRVFSVNFYSLHTVWLFNSTCNKFVRKAAAFLTHDLRSSLLQFRKKKQGHVPSRGGKKAKILTYGLSNQTTIKKNTPLTVATESGFACAEAGECVCTECSARKAQPRIRAIGQTDISADVCEREGRGEFGPRVKSQGSF